MLIFKLRQEKGREALSGRGGVEERKGGRVLVSCSRAPNDKGSETAAFIPFSRGEFLDTDFKSRAVHLLVWLVRKICFPYDSPDDRCIRFPTCKKKCPCTESKKLNLPVTVILNLLVAFDSSNNVHLRYFVVLDKTQILLKD